MKDNFQELISPLVLTLDTSASIASGIIIVNKKKTNFNISRIDFNGIFEGKRIIEI